MPYVPSCCCDRTGLCTTRWYPLQGVSYFGNPDDCFVYDHGRNTFRVAINENGGEFHTWVCDVDMISKVHLPDGANPIVVFKKRVQYNPPDGAVGIDTGPVYLEIREMRTVNQDENHAIALGTTTKTALSHPGNFGFPLSFPENIIQRDFRPYHGNAGVREDLAAADVVCKVDIGYAEINEFEFFTTDIKQVTTGGYFRLAITQFITESACGSAGFNIEESDTGSVHWLNPDGALEDEGSEALSSGEDETSHYLVGYFDLDQCAPAGAVSVAGLTLSISRRASDDSSTVYIEDSEVRLVVLDGSVGPFSENKANPDHWPTTPGNQDYGGATDLWGLSISGTAIVVRSYLSVEFPHHGADAFVDQISLTVTFLDGDGNPVDVTVNDSKTYEIPHGSGVVDFNLGPSTAVWNSFVGGSEPGPYNGFYTDYLTESFPVDISGADLADAIQPYLDPKFTVTGTGAITEGTSITLTFIHDGSIDNVYHSVDYSGLDGEGHYYVGIKGLWAFPREVANLHMLDSVGELVWSHCGSQGSLRSSDNRTVGKIEYDANYEMLLVMGGSASPVSKWTIDGEMQDLGAYPASGGLYSRGYVRRWTLLDQVGYAYSQYGIEQGRTNEPTVDLALVKYGPSGQDAALEQVWSLLLPFAIQKWTVTDESIVCAGTYPGDGKIYVAHITLNGELGWITEIPSHAMSGRGLSYLNDIWTDKSVVTVAAKYGAYEMYYSTGEMINYYPHGGPCLSAMRIITGEDNWLVLTGYSVPIEIDPDYYDIDPETLE